MRKDFNWIYSASNQEIEERLLSENMSDEVPETQQSPTPLVEAPTPTEEAPTPTGEAPEAQQSSIDFSGIKVPEPSVQHDPDLDVDFTTRVSAGMGSIEPGKGGTTPGGVGDIPGMYEGGRMLGIPEILSGKAREWLWKPFVIEDKPVTFADVLRAKTILSIANSWFTGKKLAGIELGNSLWNIPEEIKGEMIKDAHYIAGRAGGEKGLVENYAAGIAGWAIARNPFTAPIESLTEAFMMWGIGKVTTGKAAILTGAFSKIVNIPPFARVIGYAGIKGATMASGEKARVGVKIAGVSFNNAKKFMEFLVDTAAFISTNVIVKRSIANNYLFDTVYDRYNELGLVDYVPTKEDFVHDETVNAFTEALIASGINAGLRIYRYRSAQSMAQKAMYEMKDVENLRAGMHESNKTPPTSAQSTYSEAVATHNKDVNHYTNKTQDYRSSMVKMAGADPTQIKTQINDIPGADPTQIKTQINDTQINDIPVPETILLLPEPTIGDKMSDLFSAKMKDGHTVSAKIEGTELTGGTELTIKVEGAVVRPSADKPWLIDRPFVMEEKEWQSEYPGYPLAKRDRPRETMYDPDLEYKVRMWERKSEDTTDLDNFIEEFLESITRYETEEEYFARIDREEKQLAEISEKMRKRLELEKIDLDVQRNLEWSYDPSTGSLTVSKGGIKGLLEGEANKPLQLEGRKDLVLLPRDLRRIQRERGKRIAKETRIREKADRKAELDKQPKKGKLLRDKIEKVTDFVLELDKLSDRYVELVKIANHPDLQISPKIQRYIEALQVTIDNIHKLVNMASKNTALVNSEDLAALMASMEFLQPHLKNLNFPESDFEKAMNLLKSVGNEAQKIMDAKGVTTSTVPTQLENMKHFSKKLKHATKIQESYMEDIKKGLSSLLDPKVKISKIRGLIDKVDEMLQTYGEARYNNPLGEEPWSSEMQEFMNKLNYHKHYLQDVLGFKTAVENMSGLTATPVANPKQLFIDNMVKSSLLKKIPIVTMSDFLGYFRIEPSLENPNVYVFNKTNPAYIFHSSDEIAEAFAEINKEIFKQMKKRPC